MPLRSKILFLLVILTSVTFGQIVVTDADIESGQTYNMTANNTYILDGRVYVEDNAVLNIEAGTVIKGKEVPTAPEPVSALIICRGGKIFATGTQNEPIIFTAESDDLSDPTDLLYSDRKLWGGVIMLGKASINHVGGVNQIEGIPSTEPRAQYGGGLTPDDSDNSGVLSYVSIRHGGYEIGSGNEINGLTLGAVGSGTTIDHVEVFANEDDGFEFFGGTVNTKYLVSAYCADDGFDYDEGFRGKHQFWFAIKDPIDGGGRLGEHDGGTDPEDGQPYAIPIIYNATYIGPGATSTPIGDGAEAIIFRDNAGGKYYNSIITEYNGGNGGYGITVEDLASGEDSRARLEAGDLVLSDNFWWNFGASNNVDSVARQDFVRSHILANNNQIVDPQINNIDRGYNAILDPRPNVSSPAASGAPDPTDPFFDNVDYYGAFNPNSYLWTEGWTALSSNGITEVKESYSNSNVLPESFNLSQNYPNPFNPTTKINYSVSEPSNVRIAVYDVLGREIEILAEGFKPAGNYELTFNAENLPSGLYIYTFESGSTKITKKMTLLK
ncbi:MAG: T9SS type A sorting domain-containing protein [Ignavibacteriaceae bacterium]